MTPPLQAWILFGLPLILLPIIIHLINQYRHRTVKWAAMMFLLDAKRMNKGMARIKQILILAMRVIALAALIFAISRPLASGWFGAALGGAADTTIVLLDRSASMEQQDPRTQKTKRETALGKVADLLGTRGSSRLVLIENTDLKPRDLTTPKALTSLPDSGPTSTKSDIPGMIQEAIDFISANESGSTDIWILSDLRAADWDAKSGRWESIRTAAEEMEGVRFNLLVYPELLEDNISVSVTDVKRRFDREQGELLIDLRLTRAAVDPQPVSVKVDFNTNGGNSSKTFELTENETNIQGYSIRLDTEQAKRGWGVVSLPADVNNQDNNWYFVYSEPAERRTVIVSDDDRTAEPIRVAANSPFEQGQRYSSEIITPDRVAELDWGTAAMIVWHAPLPAEGSLTAQQLQGFLDQGRTLIFLPPDRPSENSLLGVRWGDWQQASATAPAQISWWRPDSDLWQNTQAGKPLPVGDLEIVRYCTIDGEGNTLARVEDNLPTLVRAPTDRGAAYFLGITPHPQHSNLAQEGISLYALLHRALAAGANGLSNAQQAEAGIDALLGSDEWKRLAPNDSNVLSSEQQLLAGAFQAEERLRALNRPIEEDRVGVVDEVAIGEMLDGVNYQVFRDQAGGGESLANEIWRSFIIAMGIALLVESILCLPSKRRQVQSSVRQPQPAAAG